MGCTRSALGAHRNHEDLMTNRASDFVDAERLNDRLAQMARLGATAAGGVDRPALSPADGDAQRLMAAWGAPLGLTPSRDPAGNFFLRWAGLHVDAAPVMSGSHLDSQPTGGKFDGVYGVVAALEAVQALIDAGRQPAMPVDIVAWMNEEGSRFAPGMLGSAAFAGARSLADTLAVTDAEGATVADALAALAPVLADIPARPLGGDVHAYIETHIEQGPVLERESLQVGVVTGIQGKHTYRVTVQGEAAHAGTSTRAERKDALLAATAMVQALAAEIHDAQDCVKFTVGRFDVQPSAPSVVASRVVFSIDLRHPDTDVLRALSDRIEPICAAHRGPCAVEVVRLSAADSLTFPHALREHIDRAATALAIPHRDLPSAAGHDARYLHAICPAAMIFVPSRDGITHNEAEYTAPADLYAGARVLTDVLDRLITSVKTP